VATAFWPAIAVISLMTASRPLAFVLAVAAANADNDLLDLGICIGLLYSNFS
jgi:hypothetical protein